MIPDDIISKPIYRKLMERHVDDVQITENLEKKPKKKKKSLSCSNSKQIKPKKNVKKKVAIEKVDLSETKKLKMNNQQKTDNIFESKLEMNLSEELLSEQISIGKFGMMSDSDDDFKINNDV
jgi:hypothetical protein